MIKTKAYLDNFEIHKSRDLIKDPKVSVLMPTYCRGDNGLLLRAIHSVLSQTMKEFELIIIDDGSVDMTEQIVRQIMEEDSRIVYIRNRQNSGLPSIKVMQGFYQSRAPYIAYQFDDDQWYPYALEVLYQAIEKEAEDTFVYGACEYVKTLDKTSFVLGDQDIDIDRLLYVNTLSNNAVLHHREMFRRYGGYDPSLLLRRVTDWDMWKRWLYSGAKAKRVDRVISIVEEQRVGSLNQTVENDITLYKMMEIGDLVKKNESLTPENYPDHPIDNLDFIEDRRVRTQIYYEKIYPFFCSRAAKDRMIARILNHPMNRPTLLFITSSLSERYHSSFQMNAEDNPYFTYFYMTKEQLTLDIDTFRYPDVIWTESVEEMPQGAYHMASQIPIVTQKNMDLSAEDIYCRLQRAVVQREIQEICIIGERSDVVWEERVSQLTGSSPKYMDLDELGFENYLIDARKFLQDLRQKMRERKVQTVINLSRNKTLTALLGKIGIIAVSDEEVAAMEVTLNPSAALTAALYHKIRYTQAIKNRPAPSAYPETYRKIRFFDVDTAGQNKTKNQVNEIDRKRHNKGNDTTDPPLCSKEIAMLSKRYQEIFMRQNLEIEELRSAVATLKKERILSRGYRMPDAEGEMTTPNLPVATDVSELCRELETLQTDTKVLLIQHLTKDHYKKMANYNRIMQIFPSSQAMIQKGYYLEKSHFITQNQPLFYEVNVKESCLERITLCMTNYNTVTEEQVLTLHITDARNTPLRQVCLRGVDIPHDRPFKIPLQELDIPADRTLRFLFVGQGMVDQCGLRVYQWKKRTFVGRSKDSQPLIHFES